MQIHRYDFGGIVSYKAWASTEIYMEAVLHKSSYRKVKRQGNFIEIALRLGCSPVNLLLIFRTSFSKNTSVGLLLYLESLRGINFVFSEFRMLIFAEVLSTPIEVQLCKNSDESNN